MKFPVSIGLNVVLPHVFSFFSEKYNLLKILRKCDQSKFRELSYDILQGVMLDLTA